MTLNDIGVGNVASTGLCACHVLLHPPPPLPMYMYGLRAAQTASFRSIFFDQIFLELPPEMFPYSKPCSPGCVFEGIGVHPVPHSQRNIMTFFVTKGGWGGGGLADPPTPILSITSMQWKFDIMDKNSGQLSTHC